MHAQMPTLNEVEFVPLWGEKKWVLNEQMPCNNGDSLKLNKLAWYISDLHLLSGSKTVWCDEQKVRLMGAGVPGELKIRINYADTIQFDAVEFYAGIDSLTNCSGAFVGSLDPVNGMYWTWQSGFINTKIEAESNSGRELQLHLGGYRWPFASVMKVRLPIVAATNKILIGIDLQSVIEAALAENTERVMQPGENAFNLSVKWAEGFKTIEP
jgi:hypothetical protein